jgi:hypothetical protein
MIKKQVKKIKLDRELPDEVIHIENDDKKFHESWDDNRNMCDIPHPFRMACLGQVGKGKSTLCKNVFLRCQAGNHPFDELIIIHGSKDTKEYDQLDPTMILNEIPEPEDLTTNDVKTLIIIDDFEMTKLSKDSLRNLSSLFRFVSSHHNISIMVCYQSFFDVPPIVRKCLNIYIIYRPTNDDELACIARRVGMKKEEMFDIFDRLLPKNRDTLMIDLTENSPCRLRKNLFTRISEKNADCL